MASEAEPWITPPPWPVERKVSGRPKALASQSNTTVSTIISDCFYEIGMNLRFGDGWVRSVTEGEQIQLKAAQLNILEYNSPKIPGYVELQGNQLKNLGCCQCVMPG